MPFFVVNGAILSCTFGLTPSALIVMPIHRTMGGGMPAANIGDFIPLVNIMPFGMCSSIANPTVASATAAAQGVLTPMPCIPATTAPWVTGALTTMLDAMPALDDKSMCTCMWAGVITITQAGELTINVD